MKELLNYHIEGIGKVVFEPSTRAKRIVIYVRPQKAVRVAVPQRVSIKEAMDFVRRKKEWIRKHLAELARDKERNKRLAETFAALDKDAAKRELTGRLKRLAEKHGFSYRRVSVRSQNTRWGSCSRHDAISLNIKLAVLPEEMQDYVMLHELTHTRIHDHSRRFWDELDKYAGSGKAMARRLRQYDTRWI